MTYERGQTYPIGYRRDIVNGSAIAPVWHALIVAPQRERKVREYLRARDVYAFFPSENIQRTIAGKRRDIERPIVTRIVFAQFRQAPQWDVMKDRDVIQGVYCVGNVPIEIGATIIKRLQGLTVEAERLREEQAELLRVRPGDRARITSGPLNGFMVNVDALAGGEALISFMAGGSALKARAALETLEREIPQ